jgi:predicted nucleotidyltransferase
MSKICSLDPRTRPALLRELIAFAARLGAELGVEAVYLFGSLARGHQHEGSDIDVLVVGRVPGRVFDAIGEILRRTDLPVEPVVVHPESLARRLAEGHPFFTRVMTEAIRLYPGASS